MNNYELSRDELITFTRFLNPEIDIRKVYTKNNSILFCTNINPRNLVIPYGFYYNKKQIKSLHSNTSYNIISIKKAIKKEYEIDKEKIVNTKSEIKNIYLYSDKNNKINACICYEKGYKLISEKNILNFYFQYLKQRKNIPNDVLKRIILLEDKNSIIDVINNNIDCNNLEPLQNTKIKILKSLRKQNKESVISTKTSKGIRKNNEDSILAITHPIDKNIKLLAVADGMGGYKYGNIASQITTTKLNTWFHTLDLDSLPLIEIITDLRKTINDINYTIFNTFPNELKGTTLTMALILKNVTIVINIGDSRLYKVKDQKLTQITEDESISWLLYKSGKITKDELRFDPHNNIILNSLGLNQTIDVTTQLLKNDDYDSLLLLSDGITDLLCDNKIQFIADNATKEHIADILVKEATEVKQDDKLTPGKDNASAVVYVKK